MSNQNLKSYAIANIARELYFRRMEGNTTILAPNIFYDECLEIAKHIYSEQEKLTLELNGKNND